MRSGSLSDYYTAAYGAVTFNKSLQRHILFADHSLATDHVFSEVHFISCRNVLIYFDRDLQSQCLGLFDEALCLEASWDWSPTETLRGAKWVESFRTKVAERSDFSKRG